MSKKLTPENALVFRITHRLNVEWILDNGLHCGSSEIADPSFVSIGNPDLIVKRKTRKISIAPNGALIDYVPFYFTPYSPMMYNIHTGWGITQRLNEDIVILVSSLHRFEETDVEFVFSNRHAYLEAAEFYSELTDLPKIDWEILQERDFRRDPDDPGKVERYQAEALAYEHVPVEALIGLVCYNKKIETGLKTSIEDRDLTLDLHVKPSWYF